MSVKVALLTFYLNLQWSAGATLNVASVRCHVLEPVEDNDYINSYSCNSKVPKQLRHLRNHQCQKPHSILVPLSQILWVLVNTTTGAGNMVSSIHGLHRQE
jgi:hypothetical protein